VDELHNTNLFDTLLPGEQIHDIKPKDNGGKMRSIEVYLNPIEKYQVVNNLALNDVTSMSDTWQKTIDAGHLRMIYIYRIGYYIALRLP
jgi:hypothetical protein